MNHNNTVQNKLSILLVDDDPDDQHLFRDALKATDLDVAFSGARNGAEALKFLKTSETLPDFVFLDLNMPVMNGIECLAEIRKNNRYKAICIAMYSTSANEEEVEKTRALGADIFIKKPFDFDDLKTVLLKTISFKKDLTNPDASKTFLVVNINS